MKFNLKDLNPGVWFDLVEDKPEEGRICIRICNGEALERIDKATVTKKEKYKRGQLVEQTKVDDEKRSRMLWSYCIVDWEGILDENGVEIPCTDENKYTLMQGAPIFSRIVSECLEKLRLLMEEGEANAEKN